ncbi:MAG: hypothetical protein WC549_03130 [Actinomycetota bacterium]
MNKEKRIARTIINKSLKTKNLFLIRVIKKDNKKIKPNITIKIHKFRKGEINEIIIINNKPAIKKNGSYLIKSMMLFFLKKLKVSDRKKGNKIIK